MSKEEFATVDDMIKILQKLSSEGYGDFTLDCNDEYFLARKEEKGKIDIKYKIISFGGHF